ncbi:MAG: 16S rRNA (cytidine(1402)-2'-O)-methyltransferase [Lachnospiraceae bacterium]|nr:16S rRNA (cytidine(1402)-2'-O)-methyltransferase [Lachnospiraceae bacterium]
MSGTLYLCATPIGNLGDMTARCIDTLKEADLIAAEDTRGTIRLLNHFDIHTPMTSYHEHNKYEKADELVSVLLQGKSIALVTDAGTPGISDPGEVLVQKCMENDIPVTSLPGCCALISALILSGLSTGRFCFEGFLPPDKKEREEILSELSSETRTILLYEAPHRLLKTLGILKEKLDPRKITLCRELTKKFEEILPFSTIGEAECYFDVNEPRGEFVLVIEGKDRRELLDEKRTAYETMTVEDHVRHYLELGMDRKEAMRQAAKDRGVPKREIYQALLGTKDEAGALKDEA